MRAFEAEKYIATLIKERGRHGQAVAVNSDEIDALRIWREFVSKEHTAGRDAPALRDVIRTAIERLRDGVTTPALDDLHTQFEDAKKREALSTRHLSALKNRSKPFVSYFDKREPAGSVTTAGVETAMASMRAGGMSLQTIKGTRTAALGLFQWALDRNLVSSNPGTQAKAPKVRPGEAGTLSASHERPSYKNKNTYLCSGCWNRSGGLWLTSRALQPDKNPCSQGKDCGVYQA